MDAAGGNTHIAPGAVRDLAWMVGVALVLTAVLVAMGARWELGQSPQTVVQMPLNVPGPPVDPHEGESGDLVHREVQLTPTFAVEGPTTLTLQVERSAVDGVFAVDIALVHEETGELHELGLSSGWRHDLASGRRGNLDAEALLDRIPTGHYHLQLEPRWEPLGRPTTAAGEIDRAEITLPQAELRVMEGQRRPVAFLGALGLLWLPPICLGIGHLHRRRDRVRSAEC